MAQLVEAAKTWTPIAAMDQTEADNVSRVQVSVKLTAFYSQFDPLDAQGSGR